MQKIWKWCKEEAVLCIAVILAAISACFVHPDLQYLDYIDVRTLAILFCLMAVMAGLQQVGLFRYVAERMLEKVKHVRSLILILVMLCFFSSMLITNDVALITFVPFTFTVLQILLNENGKKLIVPIVVLQTIAANLGSMLTPIGNPQNLYLYGKAAMSLKSFLLLMFPYTLIALVVLLIWCMFIRYQGEKNICLQLEEKTELSAYKKEILCYGILFVLCVLTVAHVIPYAVSLLVVVLVICIVNRSVLKKVDYSLLLTFVGFFVFIGNMGRVSAFNQLIKEIIVGNEVLTGVVASQFMSNVPAALLLSGFTKEYSLLIVGTNLGGLGTLIASMASLISFKYVGKEYSELRGRYLLYFTLSNVVFLMILLLYVWRCGR